MKYFYIGANLRWFLTGFQWPDTGVFKAMVSAFMGAFSNLSSGTRMGDFVLFGAASTRPTLTDYDEKKQKVLPPLVYKKLVTLLSSATTSFSSEHESHHGLPILNDKVNYVPRVEHGGVSFATRHSGLRDSFILFDTSPGQRFPAAGQITDIFLHTRTEHGEPTIEYFLVVEEYTPLSEPDQAKDPYRRFSDLETRLFYRRLRPSPFVVRLDSIRTHFAAFFYKPDDIDEDCVVVRSLDRVCRFVIAKPAPY